MNLPNLLRDGVPVHGDLTYPWNLSNYLDNYVYLFNDAGSVSNLESIDRALVLLPLAFLARQLGQGTLFIHRVLFLVIPFVSMASALFLNRYVLVRSFGKSVRTVPLVVGSLLYGLSPWVMEQMQAYLFWLAYALTPALVLCVLKFVDRPTWQRATGAALLLSLIAATPQYLAYSAIIIVIAAVLGYLWLPRSAGAGEYARRFIGCAVVGGGAFAVVNAYWIWPAVVLLSSKGQTIGPGYAVSPAMIAMFSLNSSPLNVMRGYDQWVIWYAFDPRMSFVFNGLWVVNSLLVPVLALTTLISKDLRQNGVVRILGVLGLTFGILALGARLPFYDWLVLKAPIVSAFGWILRVPGKLSYLPWLFYSAALTWLLMWLLSKEWNRIVKVLCVTLISMSLAALTIPKAAVYFYDYYAPVSVPESYRLLNRYLAREGGQGRVLYLAPYDAAIGKNSLEFETSFTWSREHLAAATPVISSSLPSIGYYHLTYRDWQETLFQKLERRRIPRNIGENYLAPAGVEYLVYHNDVVGGTSEGDADIADLQDGDLHFIRNFGQGLTLWANPTESALFSSGPFGGDVPLVEKLDPTRYRIRFDDGVPNVLRMGQPFDPLWVLRADEGTVSPNRTRDGYMSFNLPQEAQSVLVEYSPQPLYEAGLRISGFGIVGLMILLGALVYRGRASAFASRLRWWS